MAWYLRNATYSGAERVLADSDATSSSYFFLNSNEAWGQYSLTVRVYTRNGSTDTQVASGTLAAGNWSLASKNISVTVPSAVTVADGDRVVIGVQPYQGATGATNYKWVSAALTGYSIAEGTHNFVVKCESFNDSEGSECIQVYFGNQQSYAPSGLIAAMPALDAPTGVTIAFDGTDIDVTFTDNAANESGVKWKVAYDGGAYGEPTTIATPNTTSFSFTPTAGWTSAKVAVAAYNDGGTSAYAESGTVQRTFVTVTEGAASASGTESSASSSAEIGVSSGQASASGSSTASSGEAVVIVTAGSASADGTESVQRLSNTVFTGEWVNLDFVQSGFANTPIAVAGGQTLTITHATVTVTAGNAVGQGLTTTATATSGASITITGSTNVASGTSATAGGSVRNTVYAGDAAANGVSVTASVTSGATVTCTAGFAVGSGTSTLSASTSSPVVTVTAGVATSDGIEFTVPFGSTATAIGGYAVGDGSTATAAGQLAATVTVTAGRADASGRTVYATGAFTSVVCTAGVATSSGVTFGIIHDALVSCLSGYASSEGSTFRASPVYPGWTEREGNTTAWSERSAATTAWTLRH